MRDYKIFIDENLPSQLAHGLNILQQPQNAKDGIMIEVISIKDHFGEGAKDEEWIPKVGKLKGIVITQDYRIQSLKHQRELYRQYGVGILFFSPPSKLGFAYWEMVKQVIKRWEEIKAIVKKNKPPFAYRCSARAEFENLGDE
jgi:PIN like domain